MDDGQLLRYSRQLLLPQLDVVGQERLLAARVLIVGLGGLGCPAALYLAASGVGRLTLLDPDSVELSNLQRQIAHRMADLGVPKAQSARAAALALNPTIQVEALVQALSGQELQELVGQHDVVLDCTDNFAIRFALNSACVAQRRPLVSAAAIRVEAQLSVFDARRADSPCYRCLHVEGEELDQSCSRNGVLAPLVGVIGSLQALEAVKLLSGCGEPLVGRLLLFDGLRLEWRELALKKNPHCPVCAN